ncbi:MAG TPA: hypothetical protein VG406_17175 [Isosphaeraceae bacterium]|jgi:hypothetical protein|nr:hypothetical protein [Isosphaeraceae bacterium]
MNARLVFAAVATVLLICTGPARAGLLKIDDSTDKIKVTLDGNDITPANTTETVNVVALDRAFQNGDTAFTFAGVLTEKKGGPDSDFFSVVVTTKNALNPNANTIVSILFLSDTTGSLNEDPALPRVPETGGFQDLAKDFKFTLPAGATIMVKSDIDPSPEPSTAALAAIAALTGLGFKRLRRARPAA